MEALQSLGFSETTWEKIRLNEPLYLFLNKDEKVKEEYEKGIKINELFTVYGTGIITKRDSLTIDQSKDKLWQRINQFLETPDKIVHQKFNLKADVRDWRLEWAKKDLIESGPEIDLIKKISYRPFDDRFIYYTGQSRGFIGWPVIQVMKHFLNDNNVGLMVCRQQKTEGFHHALIHKNITESSYVSNKTSEIGYSFPLYLYTQASELIAEYKRTPNLNLNSLKQLLANIGNYKWVNDEKYKDMLDSNYISPLDILDYIYAILHTPTYRKKYRDFLKSDFPRIPIVKDKESFWRLVQYGSQLRKLHLLEDSTLANHIIAYPINGENIVEKIAFHGDKVFINETQYFDNVPKATWEFYIGAYQPVQKWLKDRRGKKLEYEDIVHYQKIINSLIKTIEIMSEIDQIYSKSE